MSMKSPMKSMPTGRVPASLVALVVALQGCGWATWPPAPRPSGDSGSVTSSFSNHPDAVVVVRGDTLHGLASRYRLSSRSIIEANGLTAPYRLRVGQRLILPRVREHVVSRGETLYGISRGQGVDMAVLARENGLAAPFTIKVGQVLRLPGGGSARDTDTPPDPQPSPPSSVSSSPPPSVSPVATVPPQGRPITPVAPRTSSMVEVSASAAPPSPNPAVLREAPPRHPVKPTTVSQPPPRSGHGFTWPLRGRVLSHFGPKEKGLHNDGINIAAPKGTPVRAADDGVVAYAGNQIRGFGNLLLIKHQGGWITAYAHNDGILVKRGDTVKRGQVVSRVGSTGSVKQPQLHFELRRGKRAVDPERHFGG